MTIAPLTTREYKAAQEIRRAIAETLDRLDGIPESQVRVWLDQTLQRLTAAVREYESRGWLRRRFPPIPPAGTPRLKDLLEDEADTLRAASRLRGVDA